MPSFRAPAGAFFGFVVVVVVSVLAAPACSTAPSRSEATRTVRSAIVDGATDLADVSVIEVLIQHASNPTPETSFSCTGTVVSPHVVLTAAHCLDTAIVGTGQSYYVFYGSDSTSDSQLADRKNFGYAKTVTEHPDFDVKSVTDTTPARADLGVVVLLDPAPVTPIALQRNALGAADVGRTVNQIGYGIRDPKDADARDLRANVTTPIAGVEDGFLWTEPTGHGLCEGDSGGPSLLAGPDGTPYVAGVHSWVEHSLSCTGKDYDVRVDAYADWIDSFIRDADPDFLPPPAPDAGDGVDAAPGAAPSASPSNTSSSGCSVGGAARRTPTPTSAPALALVALGACAALRRRRRTAARSR